VCCADLSGLSGVPFGRPNVLSLSRRVPSRASGRAARRPPRRSANRKTRSAAGVTPLELALKKAAWPPSQRTARGRLLRRVGRPDATITRALTAVFHFVAVGTLMSDKRSDCEFCSRLSVTETHCSTAVVSFAEAISSISYVPSGTGSSSLRPAKNIVPYG
jgi:hypothetical protein